MAISWIFFIYHMSCITESMFGWNGCGWDTQVLSSQFGLPWKILFVVPPPVYRVNQASIVIVQYQKIEQCHHL